VFKWPRSSEYNYNSYKIKMLFYGLKITRHLGGSIWDNFVSTSLHGFQFVTLKLFSFCKKKLHKPIEKIKYWIFILWTQIDRFYPIVIFSYSDTLRIIIAVSKWFYLTPKRIFSLFLATNWLQKKIVVSRRPKQ